MAKRAKTANTGGIAIVLGSAAGVLQEIIDMQSLCAFDGVVACNDMIAHWSGTLDAAVTLHPEHMAEWLAQREASGFPAPAKVIVAKEWREWFRHIELEEKLPLKPDVVTPYRFEGQADSGTSGLFALKVALVDLGYSKAICCGMPMTMEAGHFNSTASDPWFGAIRHRAGWEQALPAIAGRARSTSGWTAELLGQPDAAFVAR